ncbi:MAG: L-threonylcarbamoyladenylate synthase [Hyphomicrobiaceae bacterium]
MAEAGALLRCGELVAFPTETVYGLGADATNGTAVARIFEAKGRPRFNPLIVHVASIEAAAALAELSPADLRLAEAFWPGPLTLVLPRRADSGLSDIVSAGLDTVAVRVPRHPIARALLGAAGSPVAAPSANRSGHVSATTAAHVAADLDGQVGMILDGGSCPQGLESTIIRVDGREVVLLRPGAIPADEIARVADAALQRRTDEASPRAPGQLASHYAPRAQVRLNITEPAPGAALLAFGPSVPRRDVGFVFNLSPRGDLAEAAANLFTALRVLDQSGVGRIDVMPIPSHGLGEAINDRLRRAAAPR